jgi:hypothetical protein
MIPATSKGALILFCRHHLLIIAEGLSLAAYVGTMALYTEFFGKLFCSVDNNLLR